LLGQYFASPSTAQQLVQLFVRRVRDVLVRDDASPPDPPPGVGQPAPPRLLLPASAHFERGVEGVLPPPRHFQQQHPRKAARHRRRIVVVEPSCGDGRIVRELLATLSELLYEGGGGDDDDDDDATRALRDAEWSVLGLDVDPEAVAACRRRQHGQQQQQHPVAWQRLDGPQPQLLPLPERRDDGGVVGGLPVSYQAADFLQTRRSDFVSGARGGIDGSDEPLVVMLGGPPYSGKEEDDVGDDDDDDDDRGGFDVRTHKVDEEPRRQQQQQQQRSDLPGRFVRHALEEWRAVVLAFVMPRRCRSFDSSWSSSSPGARRGSGETLQQHWLETEELRDGGMFYFCGCEQVRQPSVLQCWWNVEDGRLQQQQQ
jgi:hypothetical protein